MLCIYCNEREAQYQQRNGNWCCAPHYQGCPAVRGKNASGVSVAYKDGRCVTGFDGHRGWSKGLSLSPWETATATAKRRRLVIERGHRCENCGNTEWMGQPIMLECHNHRGPMTDAQLLCPNCHAQTDNWRGRGKNGKKQLST